VQVELFVYGSSSYAIFWSRPWPLSSASTLHPRAGYHLPHQWSAGYDNFTAWCTIFRTRRFQPSHVKCTCNAHTISYTVRSSSCERSCTSRSIDTSLKFLFRILDWDVRCWSSLSVILSMDIFSFSSPLVGPSSLVVINTLSARSWPCSQANH